MRKVVYRRFVPAKYSGTFSMTPDKDTGVFEEKMTHMGYFHQWVNSDKGSLAIVENGEGQVEEVLHSNLKFTSPIKQKKRKTNN